MTKCAANLLTFLVAVLFALALAEVGARIFLPAPQIIVTKTSPASEKQSSHDKKTVSLSEHPDEGGVYKGTPTGRRLRPNRNILIENHRLSGKSVKLLTNSLGYRNREIGEKQGERILFLGDSVTFQDYLNDNQTFVRQVEEKAQNQGYNWETINAAVGAISLKTELAILLESGLQLDPDVVVLGFYLNDFQESKGVDIIQLPWLLKQSRFLYHLMEWVNQQRGIHLTETEIELDHWKNDFIAKRQFKPGFFNESPEAFNQMILDTFNNYGAIWSDPAWQYMEPLFKKFKSLSEQHDFQLVVVIFPIYHQVYTEFIDDYPQQQLSKIADELNIPVLDTLPALRKKALSLRGNSIYQGETVYHDLFYDQCHHTPAGSALIADEIFNFLKHTVQK